MSEIQNQNVPKRVSNRVLVEQLRRQLEEKEFALRARDADLVRMRQSMEYYKQNAESNIRENNVSIKSYQDTVDSLRAEIARLNIQFASLNSVLDAAKTLVNGNKKTNSLSDFVDRVYGKSPF